VTGGDWGETRLHQSATFQPPATAGADPITSMWLDDWADLESPIDGGHPYVDESSWSDTTFVGAGRKRPVKATRAKGRHSGARDGAVSAGDLIEEAKARTADGPPDDVTPEIGVGPQHGPESEQRRLLANSRTMAIASLISRITGFLRSSLLAAALGIDLVGDAYNGANNLPNMVYELLLGGVLSSVLIPLLVGAQEKDEDGGVAYTQRLLSIAATALGALTLIATLCAPLIAAAFVKHAEQRSLASLWATLLLPEIFFYGLGAMFMAVLNIRHSYGPGAWAPVLNNVVMILTLVVFWLLPGPASLNPSTITTPQILVIGIGTTLGIAAQALVLIPALRKTGFRWKWRFRARPNEVGRMKEVGRLALWILGYVVASQIGVTVVQKVGTDHKAFTIFTYADLLIQMPYGILVVSLLTALMPRLSRAAAQNRTADVVEDLGLGARLAALALLPVTAGLAALGPVLCVVLLGYGETAIAGGRLVGTALAVSAFGLFPFAMVMLQLRVFYAMRDGRTPTLINIGMVATKVVAILVCTRIFDGPGDIAKVLTISTSASYVVGAVLGHVALTRRFGGLGFAPVVRTITQTLIASALGGAVAFGLVKGCESLFGLGRGGALSGLVVGGLVGLAVFGAVAWKLRIPELRQLKSMLAR
jgi:putative peptidoglycan lipid II flippase